MKPKQVFIAAVMKTGKERVMGGTMKNSITVIGSLNMDVVIAVDEMPKPGQTIISKSMEYIPGGKGANQALAMARLGAEVHMLGAVGCDENGRALVENLKKNGADVSGVSMIENRNTGEAVITVNKHGQNQIIVIPGTNAMVLPSTIDKNIDLIDKSDFVVLQLEIPIDTVEYAAEKAKAMGRTVILNPAPAPLSMPDSLIRNTDILIPNESELELLTGEEVNDEESAAAAAKKLIAMGVEKVIVTMGSKGALFVSRDDTFLSPCFEVGRVADTTGAGDCFVAAFSVALTKDYSYRKAVEFANMAASIAVTRKGAQPSMPYLAEVEDNLHKFGL